MITHTMRSVILAKPGSVKADGSGERHEKEE
jgi:hypothetical protein